MFLLIALTIYVIWRSEAVLVNHLIGSVFSLQDFRDWRATISSRLPLNDLIVYSLPGGLWVFVSTVALKDFYMVFKKYTVNLMFIPISIALLLEVSQLLKLTHGIFDGWDILFELIFWIASLVILPATEIKENFFKSNHTTKKIWAIFTILILYLAHQI
jgi:hypothetical protein